MSGHKRAMITARSENIRQLSNTDMAKRFVEAGLKQLSQRLTHAAQKNKEIETAQEEVSNHELYQALMQVDEAFGQLEVDTMDALTQQEDAFFVQLTQVQEFVETANAEQFAEMNEQVQAALDSLADQHETTLHEMTEKLESIFVDNQDLVQNTQKWIEAAEAIINSLSDDPIMLGGNAEYLSYYSELINQAVENQQSGFNEAALISAQNAYRELYKARIKVYQLRRQYSALSSKLSRELELMDQELNINKQVQVFDLQGNPLESEIWVDDWIGGKLSQLQDEIVSVRHFLENKPSRAVIKKMHYLLKNIVPTWHQRLTDYVYQARSEVINSQLRMNIAFMVIKTLAIQGYHLEYSNYSSEDMRLDYQAQLMDSEGSRVLVQVEAKGVQPEATELNIFTQDVDKRSPHELKQRSIEIQKSLRKAGLSVGELTSVPHENFVPKNSRYLNNKLKIHRPSGQVPDEY